MTGPGSGPFIGRPAVRKRSGNGWTRSVCSASARARYSVRSSASATSFTKRPGSLGRPPSASTASP